MEEYDVESILDMYEEGYVPEKGKKVLPKNVRLTPQGQYRFSTEVGPKRFSKVFPKGTSLEEVEKFRDGYLKQFGVEEGQLRKVNPDRGKYVGVKDQKHIKFNGVTYQVAVQRMKDGKMVTETPFYTTDLDEAIKVRDQRVAKAPPKIEKGVFNPDREKEQRKVEKRRFIQKTKEGRSGIKFLASKGYQVHHLLPLTLASPDTNTRDLAVISAQMNREMAQFDKPIKNLTEEAFLLDYNGDRKNSFKRLNEINKELNDIVKKGVEKLGPKYKGLIGFNEIIPIPDENGQIFNFRFKPTGIDFKKSIAKDIKVPEKVKNISTSELQKLVSEAPTFRSNPFFDPKLMSRVIGDIGSGLGSPTALIGLNVGLGVDPRSSLDRAILGTEAALAPAGIKALTSRLDTIKNPAVRKGIETLAGLRLPGVFTPANVMRAARFASPLGIATLAGEGLYQLGKLGYKEQQMINEMRENNPEAYQQYLAEQQELMDVSA